MSEYTETLRAIQEQLRDIKCELQAINEQLMAKTEVAEMLGVTDRTVDNLKIRGEIHPVHVGRSLRFKRSEILRYIESRKT